MIAWETTQPEYRLALDWTTGLDGLPVCLDDGSEYDTVEATITGRLTPEELGDLLEAWEGTRLYTITTTGYLLGPEIDMSSGREVTLLDVAIDGPSDSSCTLYDVTARICGALPTAATANELHFAFDTGVPYPSSRPSKVVYHLDGGSYSTGTIGSHVMRSTRWYSSGHTTPYAMAICRELRYLRGGVYAWDTVGVEAPFGPLGGNSTFCRIVSWRVVSESNLTWSVEMDVIRESISSEGDFMVGTDGVTVDFQVGNNANMIGV